MNVTELQIHESVKNRCVSLVRTASENGAKSEGEENGKRGTRKLKKHNFHTTNAGPEEGSLDMQRRCRAQFQEGRN